MNRKGFTLVELLVAISILAILTLIAIPTLRSFQSNNSKAKYLNYRKAIETSGKLYNDSYSDDIFGEAPYGCQIIKLKELVNKSVAKDISLKDISCNIDSNNSFIVVRKYNNEYSYKGYLYCEDSKGAEQYSNIKDSIGVCANENKGPEILTSVTKDTTATSKFKSVKVILKDEYGFTADQSFEYIWTNKSDVSKLTNADFTSAKTYKYNNKPIKTVGEPVELVSKSIVIPNNGELEKDFFLAIRPKKVQNIVNLSNTELKLVGPFRYDQKAPDCPTVKVYDQTNKDLGNSGVAKSLRYELTFKDTDFKDYDLQVLINEEEKVNTTNQTATTINSSADGKYELKLKVRDLAGNTRNCTVKNYIKDETPPVCGKAEGENKTWTNKDVKVKQKCSDVTSGCVKTSYDKTYDTSTTSDTITITDKAGNTKECSYDVKVDKDKPTCDTPTAVSGWTKNDRTIKQPCSDTGGSKCVKASYDKTYKESKSKDKITISDNAGNTRECSYDVKVDKDKPKCEAATGASTSWTNQNRTINQNCSDSLSGCVKSSYKKEYTSTKKSDSVTISDNAGNTESCSYDVYVDKTPPVVQVRNMRGIGGGTWVRKSDCSGWNWVSGYCYSGFGKSSAWWYESDFRCIDSDSGCTSTNYITWNHNGDGWAKCGGSYFVNAADCDFSCGNSSCSWTDEYYRKYDNAGNYSTLRLYSEVW